MVTIVERGYDIEPREAPSRQNGSSMAPDGTSVGTESLERLRARSGQMVEELAALVEIESPSSSLVSLANCAAYLGVLGTTLLGFGPEKVEAEGRTHLLWTFGESPKVVLVGHYDTVHQVGTLGRFPFEIDGDIARGPGVCDMKGGVVVMLHAVAELIQLYGVAALDGLAIFVNADEEIGSPTSKALIERLSRTATHAIGFENAGAKYEVKTSRRGRSGYELRVRGKAAHAGERPEDGVNALGEMCAHFDEVVALTNLDAGTTVTPTMATAGTTLNTVPDRATMLIDVRCWSQAEQARVDREIRAIGPILPGAQVEIKGRVDHPPLTEDSSVQLFALARRAGEKLGFPSLTAVSVGGTADTCTFAGHGVQAIDGLGAAGGNDHTEAEWIYLSSLPEHAALAAGLAAEALFGAR